MNIKTFELAPEQLHIRKLLSKDFLELEIYAISDDYPNRNKSHFTVSSMRKSIPSFKDKPILGFFNKGDFESHKGIVKEDRELEYLYWDNTEGETILGVIRDRDTIELQEQEGKTWIVLTCALWTQYNFKAIKRLLKDKTKKVSVEIDVIDSYFDEQGIEVIEEFNLIGITILGSKNGIPVKEGIEGAHLSVLEVFESQKMFEQRQALTFAYDSLENDKKNKMEADKKVYKIKVNKSLEAMSDKAWGDVDKTALAEKVVGAENFETIAPDIYLSLEDGWEDKEVTKLKYPVMEVKEGNEAVYNRNGLASAKTYATQQKEEDVLKKLKEIYEHLHLEFDCDDDEEEHPDDCDGECDDDCGDGKEGGENAYSDSETQEDCNKDIPNPENKPEDAKESPVEEAYCKLMEECETLKMEYSKIQDAYNCKMEECKELMCKYSDLEKAYETKCNECQEMGEKIEKMEKDARIVQCKNMWAKCFSLAEGRNIPESQVEELGKRCLNGEFESEEGLVKEIALLAFNASKPVIKQKQNFSVSFVEEKREEKAKNNSPVEGLRTFLKK